MSKIKYRMRDYVACIDNLNVKMRVRKVVYDNGKLMHITCSWWEGNIYKKDDFHSSELISWAIAEKGREYVDSYLLSEEKFKKFENYETEHNNSDKTS